MKLLTCGVPVTVKAKLLTLLSTNLFDWQVNKLVPGIFCNGVVDGVNAAVYTAVPFTIRRFDIYP